MDTSVTPITDDQRARKPKKSPSLWKKEKFKTERYKPKTMPEKPTCGHSSQSYQCSSLRMCDLNDFHSLFYKKHTKEYQDHFVLKYVEIVNVKRRRPFQKKRENEVSKYKKQIRSTRYFVLNKKKERIPVCMKAFIGILGISRFRVNNITKTFHEHGFVTEKRGGFKRAAEFAPKKLQVMNFIERLQCIESHYCRKNSNRKYLSSDLNIRKLFRMYSSNGNVPVKESYFRNIFNTNYNLGFGTPRTDVCSTCLCLKEKIKAESDPKKKAALMIDKRVHKLRAKAFYSKLQDTNENLLILSFDCQKNLPIPKLPDQSTYYSRQIYVQNFTVVRGHSKSQLNKESVISYCWTENQYDKDSNTIASCVFDTLSCIDMTPYTKIRLISDGCGGQNKNSIFIGMCSFWLSSVAPKHIKEVEVVYPVTGHSFLPPDRVFGNIEKVLRKKEVITSHEEVYNIISEHATIKVLGKDCDVANFKGAVKISMKETQKWPFKISQCKRIYIKVGGTERSKVLVRGEVTYVSNLSQKYYNLLKSGKIPSIDLHPDVIEEKNKLNAEKKKDVDNLLKKHFGEDWRLIDDLMFYKEAIDKNATVEEEIQEPFDCGCVNETSNQLII